MAKYIKEIRQKTNSGFTTTPLGCESKFVIMNDNNTLEKDFTDISDRVTNLEKQKNSFVAKSNSDSFSPEGIDTNEILEGDFWFIIEE
jgi:hypothetical protein